MNVQELIKKKCSAGHVSNIVPSFFPSPHRQQRFGIRPQKRVPLWERDPAPYAKGPGRSLRAPMCLAPGCGPTLAPQPQSGSPWMTQL